MKIISLKLKNLNSLVGEHEVDFTDDRLNSAGIFAITGPTGAGKSTILDAITLALYGRAARYGSDANPENMMSRQTGECSAEVVFEVSKGRFRAEWQRHRSRNKASGSLQNAKRYVYDSSGTVIADKLRDVDEVIENLCGLDYERFLRSVLLAQGEFARFLTAKPDDRAELLERLTGTSVYSELSALAHQIVGEKQRELELKEEKIGLIAILSEDERSARQEALNLAEKEQVGTKKRLDEVSEILAQSDELRNQVEAETSALKEFEDVKARKSRHEADFAKLVSHRNALPFLGGLGRLDDSCKDFEIRKSACERAEKEAIEARSMLKIAMTAAIQMVDEELHRKNELVNSRKAKILTLGQVIEKEEHWFAENQQDAKLDTEFPEIVERLTHYKNAVVSVFEYQNSASAIRKELGVAGQELTRFEQVLETSQTAFSKAKANEERTEQAFTALLAGKNEAQWQAGREALRSRYSDIKTLQNLAAQLAALDGKRGESLKIKAKLESEIESRKADCERAEKVAQSAAELMESRQTALRFAEKVAGYEAERAQLREGEACPLCGALEHPLAHDHPASEELETLNKKLNKAKLEEKNAILESARCRDVLTQVTTQMEGETRRLAEFADEISAGKQKVQQLAEHLSIPEWDENSLEAAMAENTEAGSRLSGLISEIESAKIAFLEAEKARASSGNKLEIAEQAVTNSKAGIEKLTRQLDAHLEKSGSAEKEVIRVKETLAVALKPFGITIDEEVTADRARQILESRKTAFRSHESALQDAREAAKVAKTALEDTVREQTRITAMARRFAERGDQIGVKADPETGAETVNMRRTWSSLEDAENGINAFSQTLDFAEKEVLNRLDERKLAAEKLKTAQESVASQLKDSDFSDLDSLRAARLDEIEEQRIEALKNSIQSAHNTLEGRLVSIRQSITRLRNATTVEGEALDGLRSEKATLDSKNQELIGSASNLRTELTTDDSNRKISREQEKALEDERESMKSWKLLKNLIGSHDGRVFRRFAQGISLDVLIRHSNRHLKKLSDRYQVQRSQGHELELEIVDYFQAASVRPMSSLSGGETFLASLALALGLSDLAGRNVEIDSLFIDEGFGFLDPDTLDGALSALETLRAGNKTIGVISHVEMMRDRIPAQIAVTKKPGGVSSLEILPKR